jgi:hypothetical protein
LQRSEELAQAVLTGCKEGYIVGVNDLVVKRQEDKNLKVSVVQARSSDDEVGSQTGHYSFMACYHPNIRVQ